MRAHTITRHLVFLLLTLAAGLAWADDPAPLTASPPADGGEAAFFTNGLDGSITFGAAGAGANTRSFKFGEYTGIAGNDGYFVGNTDLQYNRDDYFMNLYTRDIGLQNREIYMETGAYGKYKFFAEFNQLPHLTNNVTATPYQNAGDNTLVLNPGYGTGLATSNLTRVNSAADLSTDRQTGTYGFTGKVGSYDLKLSYRRDEKTGLQSAGAAFGNSASPTVVRSVVLPDVVDQVANEMHAALARSGERGQLQLTFDLSLFDNKSESMIFQNPFSGIAGQPASGLISRDPDNRFWRLGLSGGYNLPMNSRLTGTFEYGEMRQDDSLLPYSFGGSTALLPRLGANAEIDTVHGTLNLTSRPAANLALQARYRHYQTINRTPMQTFRYIVNDSGSQVAAAASLNNLPFDYNQNQAEFTASYFLAQLATVKLGYQFDNTERDFREVRETRENTFKAGLNSNYFSFMSAGYNYAVSFRDEHDLYSEARVFLNRFTPANTAAFDNSPLLRRYDVAQKETFKHAGNINFFPTDNVNLGIYANSLRDEYDTSLLGLVYNRRYDVTTDLSYSPTQSLTLHAFYTFENIDSKQNSRTFNSEATAADASRNWSAVRDNNTHTVGGGFNLGMWRDRLTFSTDYAYSDSRENIDFLTGTSSALSAVQSRMPQLKTTMHTLNATGKYKVTRDWDAGLRYIYQSFESRDFATDSFAPASAGIREVLSLYGTVPNFNAHIGMVFVTWKLGASASKVR